MNQISSKLSRTNESKKNLFRFTRNSGLYKHDADAQTADENVLAILDGNAPNWNSEIVDMRNIGNMVLITAAISIEDVTRHGIGTAANCTEIEIIRAENNALVCAAKKFAFVRKALSFGFVTEKKKRFSVVFPENPLAQNLFDLITAKQISMISSASDTVKLDAERECQKVMNCGIGELSRKAAACFIAHLETIYDVQPLEVETPLLHAG